MPTAQIKYGLLEEEGWTPIDKGIIDQKILEGLIRDFFNVNENLDDFLRRNKDCSLELTKKDESRGYVFVGPLQLDRDYEARMQQISHWYSNRGKDILKSVVDFQEEKAGFSWRQT